MNAIIFWNLWQRRKSIFWWTMGIGLLVVLVIAFYPTFQDQTQLLDESLEQIPESARAFLTDTQEISSPAGYLSSQLYYLMLPIVYIVLAVITGNALIGKEEKEGTLELLLSHPISRTKLLLGKYFAGVIAISVIAFFVSIITLLSIIAVSMDIKLFYVMVTNLGALLLALTVFSLTFLCTASKRLKGMAVAIGTAVALLGYLIVSLSSIADWLTTPAKLLPFYYYKPGELLAGNVNILYFFVLTAVSVICAYLAVILFNKRDIS